MSSRYIYPSPEKSGAVVRNCRSVGPLIFQARIHFQRMAARPCAAINPAYTAAGLIVKCILLVTFSCCARFGSADPALLATHEDIEVYLLQCTAGVAHLEIQAKNGEVFDDIKSGVGKFLRTMKYIVPGRCLDAQEIKIKGTVDNELWFAAATTVADDWQVKSLFAPPAN